MAFPLCLALLGGFVRADAARADGSLSMWSSAVVDDGDLTTDAAAAMAGTLWGMRAVVDDTNGLYVQDDTPGGGSRYRARFYVDPGQFDPGTSSGHLRSRIVLAFGVPQRRLAAIVLRKQNGQYGIMGRARLDDNRQSNTSFFNVSPGPHAIEFDVVAASGPDASDGTFTLWVDGTEVGALTGLDNSLSTVDFVRMGALSVKAGATGELHFDEFESRTETYIGLLP